MAAARTGKLFGALLSCIWCALDEDERMKRQYDFSHIPVVHDSIVAVLRRMSPGQRMAMVGRIWSFVRRMGEIAVRHQHPDWDEADVSREVARRMSVCESDRVGRQEGPS